MLGAGVLARLLVGRDGHRHEQHRVEPELGMGLLRAHEVPEVRRVEHPAEDPQLRADHYGRTWPEPSTTYLYEHSSRTPMGPRAWSFCVELPISAPIPNTPPSVKRVEALTYTQAASTPCSKACAEA